MKKRISLLLGLSLLCAPSTQLDAINWKYHLKIHIPALVGTVVGFCAWKLDKNAGWQKKAVFSTVGALGSWFLTRWGLSKCWNSEKSDERFSTNSNSVPTASSDSSSADVLAEERIYREEEERIRREDEDRLRREEEDRVRRERLEIARKEREELAKQLTTARAELEEAKRRGRLKIETDLNNYLKSKLGTSAVADLNTNIRIFVTKIQKRELGGPGLVQSARKRALAELLGLAQTIDANDLVLAIQKCQNVQPGTFNSSYSHERS